MIEGGPVSDQVGYRSRELSTIEQELESSIATRDGCIAEKIHAWCGEKCSDIAVTPARRERIANVAIWMYRKRRKLEYSPFAIVDELHAFMQRACTA